MHASILEIRFQVCDFQVFYGHVSVFPASPFGALSGVSFSRSCRRPRRYFFHIREESAESVDADARVITPRFYHFLLLFSTVTALVFLPDFIVFGFHHVTF